MPSPHAGETPASRDSHVFTCVQEGPPRRGGDGRVDAQKATGIVDAAWRAAGWLTGPIFGKELRVASRRRRNYVLRAVYLAVLALFVAGTYLSAVESSLAGGAYDVSRMGVVGKVVAV